MFKNILLILFSLFSVNCQYSDVCYDDLGCFTTRPPFSTSLARPIALLPEKPEIIGVQFFLYNRENNISPSVLTHKLVNPLFLAKSSTKFIIHGFLQHIDKKWISDMKTSLLKLENCNVIVVDWSKANGFPYTKATANAQVVGAEIARLVNNLIAWGLVNAADVHLIGHNLGAHVAGYAGQRIPSLGRISGLDPAGPYFENTDPKVKLDASDATFVDVIHTDGSSTVQLGLGCMEKLGHVDFYPNGGKNQPKCPGTSKKLLNGIFALGSISDVDDGLGCSTLVSAKLFVDSILNKECSYVSYPCKSADDFNSGKCIKCTNDTNGCNEMGYWANKDLDQGILYLNTQDVDKFPYCQFTYSVTLNSNSLAKQIQTLGLFTVELNGNIDSVASVFDDSETTFKAGSQETRLIVSNKYLGNQILSAQVKFTKTSKLISKWLYQDDWSFKSVEVNYGNGQVYTKLCPEAESFKTGSGLIFNKCD